MCCGHENCGKQQWRAQVVPSPLLIPCQCTKSLVFFTGYKLFCDWRITFMCIHTPLFVFLWMDMKWVGDPRNSLPLVTALVSAALRNPVEQACTTTYIAAPYSDGGTFCYYVCCCAAHAAYLLLPLSYIRSWCRINTKKVCQSLALNIYMQDVILS